MKHYILWISVSLTYIKKGHPYFGIYMLYTNKEINGKDIIHYIYQKIEGSKFVTVIQYQ